MSLNDTIFHYVHHCNTSKEMWGNLEMLYEVSPSIKQQKMNTRGKEDNHGYFYKFISIGKFVENYFTNKYLRIKNWKFNPTLESADESLYVF